MNRVDRIGEIEAFMKEEFSPSISPKPIEERLWPAMIALTEGADVHRPFGYSHSHYMTYDERWTFFYCSGVIAETTAELDDTEFRDWLRYIRAHVSTHTTMDTTDENVVDSQVFSVLPEARDLVGKVHDHMFAF